MNSRFAAFLLLVPLMLPFPGRAQQDSNPVLPPPTALVKQTPTGTSWLIAITYEDDDDKPLSPAEEAAKKVRPTATQFSVDRNNDEGATISYADQHQDQFYYINGFLMQMDSAGQQVLAWRPTPVDSAGLRTPGFPKTAWISKSNYVGVGKWQKTPCYKYTQVGMTAYIDPQTYFPLAITFKNATYTFSELSDSVSKISVPPEFQAVAHKIAAQKQLLEAMQTAERR